MNVVDSRNLIKQATASISGTAFIIRRKALPTKGSGAIRGTASITRKGRK